MFDQLRTKQQLGYSVSCSHKWNAGVSGLIFAIKSASYDPIQLEHRVFEFISKYFNNELDTKFDETKQNKFINGMISSKSEPFKDIYEEMDHYINSQKN